MDPGRKVHPQANVWAGSTLTVNLSANIVLSGAMIAMLPINASLALRTSPKLRVILLDIVSLTVHVVSMFSIFSLTM